MWFPWYPYDSFGQDAVACALLGSTLVAVWKLSQAGYLVRAISLYLGVMTLLVGIQQVVFDTAGYGSFFGVLRMQSWAIFVFAPLACGIAAKYQSGIRQAALLGVAFVLVLVGVDAFWVEPYRLQMTSYTMTSAKVTEPTKVVLIADIQTDVMDAYTEDALRQAIAQNPDLVVFAGDYLQYSFVREFPPNVAEFNRLLHDLGYDKVPSIVVEGDVEDKLEEKWQSLFEGLPAVILDPSGRTKWRDWEIIGLTRNDSMYGVTLEASTPDDFTIIIGHNPNFALQRPQADLYLAGHTHGGQVNLPWFGPLITFSDLPNDQAQGLTKLENGATLIVSRGIGMERVDAPRIRFLCPPEIVIIDILPISAVQ